MTTLVNRCDLVLYSGALEMSIAQLTRAMLFCGSFLFMFRVCLNYVVLVVPCSLVIPCLERADQLCLMIFGFFHFPHVLSRFGCGT